LGLRLGGMGEGREAIALTLRQMRPFIIGSVIMRLRDHAERHMGDAKCLRVAAQIGHDDGVETLQSEWALVARSQACDLSG